MAGFNPISAVLAPVTTLAGLAQGTAQTQNAYRQAQQQYRLNERIIADQEKREREKIALENENASRTRQAALKRAVSRQHALYGAQGIDASDGSGEAVLLGLLSESDAEKDYRDRLDTLRQQALQQDSAAKRQRNLLNMNTAGTRYGNALIDTLL